MRTFIVAVIVMSALAAGTAHASSKVRKDLREKFEQRMKQDRAKYSAAQLKEAEALYQVANRKWGTQEATESLGLMIQKYPDINRTGCAVLYLAQKSKEDVRTEYLENCLVKYNGCMYGDGVQVGAFALFLLADDFRKKGDLKMAAERFNEVKSKYPDAVNHSGALLVNSIPAEFR